MPNLISDLRDPSPPVPGARERDQVAIRARQLGRRRRLAQGAGALAVVAAVTVGVAALAGNGSDPNAGRVQAASAGTDTTVAATTPAAVDGTASAASGFTISGTVANIPADVTVTLTLKGDAGTFTAVVDDAGRFAFTGVPTGTYDASYEWVDPSGTATQVGRLGGVDITGDSTVNFSL